MEKRGIELIDVLNEKVPELGQLLDNIANQYSKRLWHPLTNSLSEFVTRDEARERVDLVELYRNFIKSFETRINQLSFVRLAVTISKQIRDLKERIDFVKEISDLPKVQLNPEAYITARSVLAQLLVANKDRDEAKTVLEGAKAIIEQAVGAEAGVYSIYYKAWADYYQFINDSQQFYNAGLQFVAYTPLESIDKQDLSVFAFDLGIAALLGKDIYNFGDLLEHPVLESLQGSDHQWLAEVIYAFNKGEIAKWKVLQNQYATQLNEQQRLREEHSLLQRKISVMSLVELVFSKPSDQRNISFDDISKATEHNLEEVELIIMAALSLGLVRGIIDEVDKIVSFTWVQPRILTFDQINNLSCRLNDWTNTVKSALSVMESGISTDLTT